jgi:signal transduction histidine kinase
MLERIALLAIIVVVIGIDVLGIFVIPDVPLFSSLLSIATTAVFAIYLRSPAIATVLLGIVLTISFFVTDASVLLAAAVAAGLVMRLGRTSLVLCYTAVFVVSAAVVGFDDAAGTASVGVYLIMATVSGAVGLALRAAAERGRVLEHELAESAEQERQAVLAERRWIAGELHDSIAHHLTVVALHVQMLDDPKVSAQSQEAIRVAARKAMADVRFVIELADDGPRASSVPTGDLGEAIEEARTEISAAGHDVVAEGDPLDERIPRIVDIVFARIVRESATNILKHAGAGEVAIRLQIDDEHATLSIRSPLPTTPRRDLPSSGTGLNRMAERVIGASGEFAAGPVEDAWQVSARLPMT